ncbi:MAG: hypothetical protein NZ108_05175, partial [Bacteroidia bacterium]|nr:hypothetical protein [Bacteroidia bacterium]
TVPILAGARLSGKLNRNWRIGLMNLQTEGIQSLNLNPQNYFVAAAQRQIKTSNLGFIFVNRQKTDWQGLSANDFNRIFGIEYNLQSKDGKWQGKGFYQQAFLPQQTKDNFAHASWLMYYTPKLFVMWNHEYVGKNFIADVGFVPRIHYFNPETRTRERLSYWRLEPEISWKWFPKSKQLNNFGPGLYADFYLDSSFVFSESHYNPYFRFKFQNSAEISLDGHFYYTKLFFPTNVTGIGMIPFPSGEYRYQSIAVRFTSNVRKKLNYQLIAKRGSFYRGNEFSYNLSLNYRWQPWSILALNVDRYELTFPEPYSNSFLTLIGPRIDLTFSRQLFLTTFLQYNTQAENVNLNTRLQWRFRPMSDLFIVYSDNYTPYFQVKNHALVIKFVWWLSI